MPLPDNKIAELIDYAQGSCNSEHAIAEAFGIDADEVLEIIIKDGTIDRCYVCSWWCELSELEEHKGDDLVCADCRDYSDEEESE